MEWFALLPEFSYMEIEDLLADFPYMEMEDFLADFPYMEMDEFSHMEMDEFSYMEVLSMPISSKSSMLVLRDLFDAADPWDLWENSYSDSLQRFTFSSSSSSSVIAAPLYRGRCSNVRFFSLMTWWQWGVARARARE